MRVGELEQHQAALGRASCAARSRRPSAAALAARSTSSAPDAWTLAMTLPSAGFSTSSVSPGRRVDPFAADELLVGLDALEDVGHRGASWDGWSAAGLGRSRHRTAMRGASRPVGRAARVPSASQTTIGSPSPCPLGTVGRTGPAGTLQLEGDPAS